MSYNRVILLGNLTRDPELSFTPKGTAACKLSLALNHKYTTADGEKREEVTFVDVVAWGKTGEVIAQYLHKGDPLHLEGRLKLDQWDDKKTGEKRQRLTVVLESFTFVGGKDATPKAEPQWPKGKTEPEKTTTDKYNTTPEEETSVPF